MSTQAIYRDADGAPHIAILEADGATVLIGAPSGQANSFTVPTLKLGLYGYTPDVPPADDETRVLADTLAWVCTEWPDLAPQIRKRFAQIREMTA